MKILVIGGTVFIGRHIVQAALERGHHLTLFNRGKTNDALFPTIEKVRGDRSERLDVLGERHWDAVIDTCGYVPAAVRTSAEFLQSVCSLYVFISTGAVYKDKSKFGITEDAELEAPHDMEAQEWTDETYGALKAGCEGIVRSLLGSRALIIRPGPVVGPHDPTDRFTYWPLRISRGGRVLAPGNPLRQVQFIDARDLAHWTILMVERQTAGIYNAIGPDYALSWSRLLNECITVCNSNAELAWVSEALLQAQKVNRFEELPLWIPEDSSENGFFYRSNHKAIAAGLKFRPLHETIANTLEWWQTERRDCQLRSGLSSERESQLLAIAQSLDTW